MNPFDQSLFSMTAPCLPCCTPTPPAECQCALLIPPFASPYVDYTTAAAAIANLVADCLGYTDTGMDSFSVDDSVANEITVSSSLSDSGASTFNWVCVTIDAGTLVLDWSNSFTYEPGADEDPFFQATVYDCSGTLIDTQAAGDTSGTFNFTGLPSGTYYIFMNAEDEVGDNTSVSSDVTISSATLVPNPVIALWDDSGTTRKLWACPKFILPTVTEAPGTWYADCASAAGVITDDTQSCLAYYKPDIGTWGSKSASGGSSLSMAGTLSGTSPNEGGTAEMYGGIFAVSGGTLSLDYSVTTDDSTGTLVTVNVYDAETLAILFTDTDSGSGTVSGTFNYAVPYTGRFIVIIVSGPSDEDSTSNSVSLVVSSSSAMQATEIQALYDVGLDCPARLNCGDSCP